MGTLWNTYAFYILYANIDKFDPTQYKLEYDKLAPMDKWILSKLETLSKFVDESLAGYKLTEPSRAMADFMDDLSNWYVRRSRERFWAAGMEQDKVNAYMTLYTVLETVVKLAAPFTPFISEEIYGNLVRSVDASAPESVHLCDWPAYREEWVDADLEANMDLVLKVVVEGRSARNTSGMKNRQPLAMMYVKAEETLPEEYLEIIKDELNVKAVSFTDDVEAFTTYTFKPQLRTLGKKYGKLVPAIGAYLKEVDGSAFMAELKANGKAVFTLEGEEIVLEMDDVLYDTAQKGGFVSSTNNNLTVVLDTNLTDELVEEGFVREIISKVQTMRKEADFNVTDRIKVYHDGNATIAEILAANDITGDVLAVEVVAGAGGELSKEWNINGEKVTLGVARV
jgi:isoleucyl-tRNA synthetase